MAKVVRFVPAVVSDPLTSFDDEACVVELSPDKKRILIGGGFSLRMIDAASGKDVKAFRPDDAAMWSARFTPDGARVIGGIGDRLLVWNAKTGAVVHELETSGIVRRVSISRDGKRALSSTWEKDVRLWDLAKGKELGGFTMEKSFVNGAAVSPDAKLVACGGSDGVVRLCDPTSGDVKKAVTGKGWIEVIERADAAPVFATAGREAQVILWDWTGKKLRTLTDVSSAISALALSPDGKLVAACGKKATPLVWSVESGKVVAALEGHDKVTALSFSRDGRSIVTAGPPRVRVWTAPSSASPTAA
jgi:WD40 repeat protein